MEAKMKKQIHMLPHLSTTIVAILSQIKPEMQILYDNSSNQLKKFLSTTETLNKIITPITLRAQQTMTKDSLNKELSMKCL